MIDYDKYIADRLAYLRSLKNMSARELSYALGQSSSYVSSLENNKSKPSLEGLYNICDYFNITPAQFFSSGDKNPLLVSELIDEVNKMNIENSKLLLEIAKKFNK